ncbi:hypothetical protein EDD85DRAFT_215518 [Armillaria nabsnona]|nr:hypothetical protein EDD85DRAFT_215518 [Armillaria nabsnona]
MKPARDCAVRPLDLLLFLFPFPTTFLERQSARTRNRIVPTACYDLDLDPAEYPRVPELTPDLKGLGSGGLVCWSMAPAVLMTSA